MEIANVIENYKTLTLNNPNAALVFLTGKLGFEIVDRCVGTGLRYVLIRDPFKNTFKLLLTNESMERDEPKTVTLYTDDCLKSYYDLKLIEVEILEKPVYTTEGLIFSFIDPSGNKYAFLEKRSYREFI